MAESIRGETAADPGDESAVIDSILSLLQKQFEVDLSLYRVDAMKRRVRRRSLDCRCRSLAEYHERLSGDTAEREALLEALLVEPSQFFRDPEVFSTTDDLVVPELIGQAKESADTTIRIGVPGCGTGEEAYTLAMLFAEATSEEDIDFLVIATDVHEPSLQVGRIGVYEPKAFASVSETLRTKYVSKHGTLFRVCRELRDRVLFSAHDITTTEVLSGMDLVSYRHVLLNFNAEVRQKIVARLHAAVRSSGYLLLGSGESLGDLSPEFEAVHQPHSIYRKRRDVRLLETPPPRVRQDAHRVASTDPVANVDSPAAEDSFAQLTAANHRLETANDALREEALRRETVVSRQSREIASLTRIRTESGHLLENSDVGMLYLDLNRCIRRFTPAIAAKFHLMEQDIGRSIDQFSFDLDQSTLADDASHVLASGTSFERKVATRDGSTFLIRIHPCHSDNTMTGVVVTFTDISSVVQAEKERKQREHLERVTADLQDFAYAVSHDLKAPIRHVLGFANQLKDTLDGHHLADVEEDLHMITTAAEKLNRLLDCLLEYSRVNTRGSEPQLTDLNDSVARVLSKMSKRIGTTGAVIRCSELPILLVDGEQFELLFENLIENAIKFGDSPQRIEISARTEEGHAVISVRDHGIGIQPQHLEDVFVVFRRFARHEEAGNGLGLAVCKRIVERHNGSIWVESTPGEGACFHVRLPTGNSGDDRSAEGDSRSGRKAISSTEQITA